MTRFFQTRFSRPATLTERDSDRFTQTTLQAQASEAVARREYAERYPRNNETREVLDV